MSNRPEEVGQYPTELRPYLTIAEAMRLARVSRSTAHERIDSQRWRSFKDGKRRYVITASIFEDAETQARLDREEVSA